MDNIHADPSEQQVPPEGATSEVGTCGAQQTKAASAGPTAAESAAARGGGRVGEQDHGEPAEFRALPEDVGTSEANVIADTGRDLPVSLDVAIQEALINSSRLRELNRLFAGALSGCLGPLTDADVQQLMRELPEPYLPVLKELNNQVYKQIGHSCSAEFVEVIQDNQVDVLLNELDFRGEQALRLLGATVDPKKLMATERVKVKRAEIATLQKMMAEVQVCQTELEADLCKKKEEVRAIVQNFPPIVEELGAVEDASRQWTGSL